MTPVLSVRELEKRFGAVVAADALSLDIAAGQKVSLIGANGAGKTTFVNMVTGYLKPDSGSIALDGMDIGKRSPRNVARLGISLSFQIPQLFIELTAAENLTVAVAGARAQALSLHSPADAHGDKVLELLERFGLGGLADRPISELAGDQPLGLIRHDNGGAVSGRKARVLKGRRQRLGRFAELPVGEARLLAFAVGFDQADFFRPACKGIAQRRSQRFIFRQVEH